jgi:hypothetical protein
MAISSKFPVLSLSTVKPNGFGVEIDGEIYESMPPASWGAEHSYAMRQYLNDITAFESKLENAKSTINDDEVKTYKYNLRTFAQFILPDAPKEKVAALPDGELGKLVQYFLSVLRHIRTIPSLDENGKIPIGSTLSQDSVENIQE